MLRLFLLPCLAAHAFSPALPTKNFFRQRGVTVNAVVKHDGIACDCCDMDPIVGARFACTNVDNLDICGVCALSPPDDFSINGKSFAELTWKIIASPFSSSSPPAAAAARPAGAGAGAGAGASPASAAAPVATPAVAGAPFSDLATMVDEVQTGQAILLDVREPAAYEVSHVCLAMPAPFSSLKKMIYPENRDTAVGIELNKKIYVQASSEPEASVVADFLARNMKYTKAVPLDATFDEVAALKWASPLAKGAAEALFEHAG